MVVGCSSINTGNKTIDALYNNTSALLEGEIPAVNCDQFHELVRERCLQAKKDTVDRVNKTIIKK